MKRIGYTVCCAAFVAISLFAAGLGHGQTIPAWLDDAISEWNEENPKLAIQFVDFKDSYVWYMVPDSPETGNKAIRESVFEIVTKHDYQYTDEEEMIATAKPPSPTTPYKDKKCWKRSYVRNMQELSNTKSTGGRHTGMSQRMLTTLVCDDRPYWFMGFRILQ